ncbi:MAG: hypothetical protein JSV52_06980 [Candidatus Zixiibacteriota bacterium]|nr:MAG: hypothetical protein JSV52_06980 [candidate division Zixibacteria bacterium]
MSIFRKVISSLFVVSIIVVQTCGAYESPRREIELKPYVHLLFPDNLLKYEEGRSLVKNEEGIGVGLKIRTQITGPLGFVLNASVSRVKPEVSSRRASVVTTMGPFYVIKLGSGRVLLEMSYGYMSAADHAFTVFLPSIEYSYRISERVRLSAEIGLPVANDWFYDYDVSESAKSISLSIGAGFVF